MTQYEQMLEGKQSWHNQACASCGVTAELHGSCAMDGRGPMTPSQKCDHFVWSERHCLAAMPPIVMLDHRVAKLEEKCGRR